MTCGTIIDIVEPLAVRGWTRVDADPSMPLEDVAGLVTSRSATGATTKTLVPRERSSASPFSLSARFGLSGFDAHSDGAAEPVPPRWGFMRLAAGAATRTPTLLWDLPTLDLPERRLDGLRRAMWVVRGGPVTFYSSILRRYGGVDMLRFNRTCMQPVSRQSAEVGEDLATILLLTDPIEHQWVPGEVLVFDNWRVLHARPRVSKADAVTRRLDRLLLPDGA